MDLDKLYAPFEVHIKPGQGFKYIKGADVIDRMNKVFEGRWGSTVMSETVVEDEIIVRVRVTVHDSDGVSLSHEGYGSSNIKRKRNSSEALNIGHDYKGALTMAIRNACSKWGAGLYLEEVHEEHDTGSGVSNMPSIPTSIPTDVPKKDYIEIPVPEASPPPKKVGPPPFPAASPPKEEKAEEPEEVKKDVEKKKATVKKSKDAFPKIPLPKAKTTQPKQKSVAPPVGAAATKKDTENKKISDIQRAALNGALNLKGIDYTELVTSAFSEAGMDTGSLPAPDNLSYKEAVVIIKYANKIKKDN